MRAVLALLLLAGFFVLVFVLTVGLAGLAVWVYLVQDDPGGAIWLGVIAALVAAPVGLSVIRALRFRPEPSGLRLTQPELLRHVHELARIAGTRTPDDIRLVPEANAAVWERNGRRYLELGLPLLASLTIGELRSVLAHEFGHYGGGHTRLSALTFRAKIAMQSSIGPLQVDSIGLILVAYARLYALVAASVSRDHELFADEVSVSSAGRATAQDALRKIGPLDRAWTDFVENYLSLAVQAGRTPPVLAGFREYLGHPRRVQELRELERTYADQEPKSVFDSHPPIRERIAAMERMTGPEHAPDDTPAWTLLGDLPDEEFGPPAEWAEVVALAGPARVRRQAQLLAHAGRTSGIGGTIGELLDGLERGELRKLTGDVVDPRMPEAEVVQAAVETVTELLGFAVADALVHNGRATLELNWGGVFVLRQPDGGAIYADDLVAPAVRDPAGVPAVRDRLRTLGVDGV